MSTIPFIKVQGNHFECGQQIGQQFHQVIGAYIQSCKSSPPSGLTWSDCLLRSQPFLAPMTAGYPEIVEELRGVSQATGISFPEIFTTGIEELYANNYSHKNCTDIIATSPASAHTLVVHNNDLTPSMSDFITSVEWNFADGTKMFTVGLAGYLVSVGVNNSKIVLTGNELTPNDNKPGIPRAYIARAILLATSFDRAIEIATDTNRASSYNNIISTIGKSVSIEGSATSYDLLLPTNGILTHSNHYCSTKMLSYEGKSDNYPSSIERLKSANTQSEHMSHPITLDNLKDILRSHGPDGSPSTNTICRHSDQAMTVFGIAIDVDAGLVELAAGNPCRNQFRQVWQF